LKHLAASVITISTYPQTPTFLRSFLQLHAGTPRSNYRGKLELIPLGDFWRNMRKSISDTASQRPTNRRTVGSDNLSPTLAADRTLLAVTGNMIAI
jgi:hypothetical protein